MNSLKNKNMIRPHSISSKLIIMITLLISIISLYLYLFTPKKMTERSIKLIRDKAKSISTMTAYSVRAALDFELIDDIDNAFSVARQNKDIEFIVLKNDAGEIVNSFNLKKAENSNYEKAKTGNNITRNGTIFQIMTPVVKDNRHLGELYLGLSLKALNDDISSFKQMMLGISIMIFLFGIAAAFGISRIVTSPLQKIVSIFNEISKGDLSKRAEIRTKDEIGQLAESFNLMVESLEFAMNELGSFNQTLQGEIKERKKVEEELRKLTRAVIESPVSMIITNVNKIVEYVNPKFYQSSGYLPDEVIGTLSPLLVEAEQDPGKYNNLWETIINDKEWKGEILSRRKNGELYWEIVSISPITDAKGEITHFITVKEDITQRKMLEETSNKYDFIVNTSKEFMSLINRDYIYEAVNEQYCLAFNLPRNKIVGRPMLELWGSEIFYNYIKKAIDECFTGKEVSFQHKLSFGILKERYMDIHYYPYENSDGEITHIAAVAKDISEQKKAEQVLKESEERYKGLVSNLPDLIIVHKKGKIVYANTVVYDLLGYTAEDVLGKHIMDFIVEEYQPKVLENTQKRMKGIDIPSYEIELYSKSGSRLFVEIRGSLISYDQEPATLNVLVNVTERKMLELRLIKINEELEQKISERTVELTDAVTQLQNEIDERKLIEESLRDSEEKFKALAEYSKDYIMRFDRNSRLLYLNRTMIGYKPEEVLGKNQLEIGMPVEIYNIWTEAIKKVFETKTATRIEFEAPNHVWIDAILSPEFTKDDKVKTVLASARDITELKKNEYELIHAKEQALESSRLKSEFLANMSHEIRTPMNAILGFTDLLSMHINDRKLKGYLDAIKSGGKNLLTLINDILDLSKIEAGKMELRYEPVNPYTFISETKNIFAMRIAEKNLDFIISIDPHLPESLLLDEVRLRQVLFNLIGNAVKFTETGFIKLSLSKVYRQEDRSSLDLILTVEDSGIGIPAEAHDKIFESFKQLNGQSSKQYGGTGLGLAITRRLVEMMNGTISLRSEVNKGSCFEITLFDVSAASTAPKPPMEDTFDHSNLTFDKSVALVVDDIELNRNLIKEFFHHTNIEILEAENGQQAIRLTEEYKPDIVLMDIRMPVLSGFEAIKIIKSNPDLKSIPVIAITASAMKEDEQKIIDAGFDGYLVKPVQIRELFRELTKFLKHTTKLQPDEQAAESISDQVTVDNILKLSGIIEQIEQQLVPLWETACKNHFIHDIIGFGNKIKDTGSEHSIHFLERYGDDLVFYANNFDIESINLSLEVFPKILEKVKSLHSKD